MSTGRLESFSDGVLAVAITLLILNVEVPDPASTRNLAHALLHNWQAYAAYAISFLTIGIIWINHHATLSRLRMADHVVMILNLLLLASVVMLPFSTNLFATYLKAGRDEHLAAAVYGGSLFLMGVLFSLLQRHILSVHPDRLGVELSAPTRRRLLRRNVVGVTPYLLATVLAPVSAYLTFAITAAVAVFYALPVAVGED